MRINNDLLDRRYEFISGIYGDISGKPIDERIRRTDDNVFIKSLMVDTLRCVEGLKMTVIYLGLKLKKNHGSIVNLNKIYNSLKLDKSFNNHFKLHLLIKKIYMIRGYEIARLINNIELREVLINEKLIKCPYLKVIRCMDINNLTSLDIIKLDKLEVLLNNDDSEIFKTSHELTLELENV